MPCRLPNHLSLLPCLPPPPVAPVGGGAHFARRQGRELLRLVDAALLVGGVHPHRHSRGGGGDACNLWRGCGWGKGGVETHELFLVFWGGATALRRAVGFDRHAYPVQAAQFPHQCQCHPFTTPHVSVIHLKPPPPPPHTQPPVTCARR